MYLVHKTLVKIFMFDFTKNFNNYIQVYPHFVQSLKVAKN